MNRRVLLHLLTGLCLLLTHSSGFILLRLFPFIYLESQTDFIERLLRLIFRLAYHIRHLDLVVLRLLILKRRTKLKQSRGLSYGKYHDKQDNDDHHCSQDLHHLIHPRIHTARTMSGIIFIEFIVKIIIISVIVIIIAAIIIIVVITMTVVFTVVIFIIFPVSAEITGIIFVEIVFILVSIADDVQLIAPDNHRIRVTLRRYRHKISVRIHQRTLHILDQFIRIPVSSLTVLLRTFQNNLL